MKSLVFNGENGISLNYIFQKPQNSSDVLVVSFPGLGGTIPGGDWGYLMTIIPFGVNALFIKSDRALNQSWLTYKDGKPLIENTIKALIDKCAAESNVSRIITTGSSMGGFCAIYYGLKYGYDIIAGSPPYTITEPSMIMFATGGIGESEERRINEQLHSAVRNAGEQGFDKKLFISWGNGEANWLSANQGQQLITDLENAKIKFAYKLYPYSDHYTVYQLFPNILKERLGYYLGLNDEPKDDETELSLSPEGELTKKLNDISTALMEKLSAFPEDTEPYTSIQEPMHYGDLNIANALRNFVYLEQGWYWGGGFKEPLKMPDKNAFWRVLPREKVAEGVCFWFQDTLLNYYEQQNEPKALAWCAENAHQYIEYISRIADPRHNEYWWNSLKRMHFFMALHKDLDEKEIREEWHKNIPDEIRRDIKIFIPGNILANDYNGQYRRALGLLHAAVYFKKCNELYDVFYNAALTILDILTDFYFNENGVCIIFQFRDHSILAERIMQNIRFIETNNFPETKEFRTLKRKYDKIIEFAAHITAPDGNIAAVGQSIYEKAWSMQKWLKRKTGNYILRNSNIAILNDENDLAYITVNGCSNTRSNYKHCDLLSFTFWYDNVQVFMDSEGGVDNLAEFASSAMAHNGIIIDDLNYMIPSYNDFTAIETVDERDDCVIIDMSHNCYEGVTLRRRLMWIKPNIIVLYDETDSHTEHKYTQNFVLQNWNVDKKDKSKALISVAPDFTATITQINADDNDFELEAFYGTTDVKDEAHYRGSLVSGWRRLRKGCNLAYTKNGSNVKFLTVIELHGASNGISEQESHVLSAKTEFDKLAVTLENGTEICENGLAELRELTAKEAEECTADEQTPQDESVSTGNSETVAERREPDRDETD